MGINTNGKVKVVSSPVLSKLSIIDSLIISGSIKAINGITFSDGSTQTTSLAEEVSQLQTETTANTNLINTSVTNLNSTINDLENEVETEILNLNTNIDNLQSNINDEVSNLNISVSSLEDNLATNISSLNTSINELESDLDANVSNLNDDMDEFENDINNDISNLNTNIENIENNQITEVDVTGITQQEIAAYQLAIYDPLKGVNEKVLSILPDGSISSMQTNEFQSPEVNALVTNIEFLDVLGVPTIKMKENVEIKERLKIGPNSLLLGSANGGVDNYIYTDNGRLRINADETQGTIYLQL